MTVERFYKDVPGLGHVAVSRHTQRRAGELGVTSRMFEDVLYQGEDTPDGMDVVWRQRGEIRLIILLRPEHIRRARLVKTVMRVGGQAVAKKTGKKR